jgi:hypothetical protein
VLSISDCTVLTLLAVMHASLWALQLVATRFFNLF